MCTISWLREGSTYHVFFNRDEQKERPLAQPPCIQSVNGVNFLTPTDPQGGGSWLSVNERGVCLALLNYYQGRWPKGALKSRGQIVTQLASATTLAELETGFAQFALERFAPFTLLVFSPQQSSDNQVPCFRWSGKSLLQDRCSSPFISSAKFFELVKEKRLSRYRALISSHSGVDDFYRLHRDHAEKPSATSVCMHREDASTVSFSHIQVSQQQAHFRYFAGLACEALEPVEASLDLIL